MIEKNPVITIAQILETLRESFPEAEEICYSTLRKFIYDIGLTRKRVHVEAFERFTQHNIDRRYDFAELMLTCGL
jgi:hypothetical protein